jgi:hypothetical protein
MKTSNSNFSYYLTGLIEGDGTFYVPKPGRKDNAKIEICFHSKDLPLAKIIQKTLNFGSIYRKKGVNAYTLSFNKKED